MTKKINWDVLGILASVACAIHCAILPLLVSSLPILGINIIHNRVFEYGMIALAFVVGAYSLLHGFRRHHSRYIPLVLFSAGMAILLAKQHWHEWEAWFLPFAVSFIVMAHWINFKLSRSKKKSAHLSLESAELT